MISGYVFENGRLVEADDQMSAPVLICSEPDQIEKMFIQTEFNLGQHTMTSMLDAGELPRIESRGGDKIVIICKHPLPVTVSEKNIEFHVISLGAVIYGDRLLFICDEKIPMKTLFTPMHMENIRDVLLNMLHRTTLHFHEHLRGISLGMDQKEEEVIETASTELLMELFSVAKHMTYYVSALNGNHSLIERIYQKTETLGFNEQQKEILDDIRLDSAQCCQAAQITTSIMTKMTDARIALMGNNVSVLMKRLTLISLGMMPLNLIAGIGGMSEFTAFSENYLHLPMGTAYLVLFAFLGIVSCVTFKILQKMRLL